MILHKVEAQVQNSQEKSKEAQRAAREFCCRAVFTFLAIARSLRDERVLMRLTVAGHFAAGHYQGARAVEQAFRCAVLDERG